MPAYPSVGIAEWFILSWNDTRVRRPVNGSHSALTSLQTRINLAKEKLRMNFTPKLLAEKGENIYKQKYQQEYERLYPGKFAAIDVETQKAYIADSPEAAVESLQKENPLAFFHLVKIGSNGVFKVGYSLHSHERDWLLQ
jgi:hypothetical protein